MAERSENLTLAAMDGPRAVLPDEHASAIELINLALRPGKPPSILDEYPLVLGKENLKNIRVILHEGRVVSHAAIYYSKLRTGDLVFRVGGIGSVATHPEYRGKGLAGAVIDDCLKMMHEAGCHLSVLWTQRYSFYRQHGFELSGSEYLFRLHLRHLPPNRRRCRIVPYSPQYLPEIIQIHEREPLRNERTQREYEIYFSLPKTRGLVSLRNASVTAYAVMGKGEDFRNCIHEWGGNPDDLLCLVRELAATANLNEVAVLTPAGDNNFVRLLRDMHAPSISEHLAMMRVVEPESFLSLVHSYLLPKVDWPFQIESDGGAFVIHIGNEHIVLKDMQTLVRLVFGPDHFSDSLPQKIPPEMLGKLNQTFPIPLFIWGLDSV
jgi:N-acetylglutamate synthase-like GNAT family acetyltransferase